MIPNIFDFIVWNVSPDIFSIGNFTLRWYGLLFASGFLIGQQILIRIYKQEGKTEKHVETLTVYMVLATIIGARLGHCLFYQPEIYLNNPIEILYIWEGGLASHGATIGILIAIFLYSRKQTDQSYLYVLDRIVITIALAGCLIRIGNLMNSEIYGKPTDTPWAFVFIKGVETEIQERYKNYLQDVTIENTNSDTTIAGRKFAILNLKFSALKEKDNKEFILNFTNEELSDHLHYGQHSDLIDNVYVPEGPLNIVISEERKGYVASVKIFGIPRHPSQIYEAGGALLLFFLLIGIYKRYREKTPEGRIFGLFVVILFTNRFLIEFIKAPQVNFENNLSLNMGQILSLPLIIAGMFVLIKSFRKKNEII